MIIKDREDYTVEDFLMDESFLNYHFHLNKNDELMWSEWLGRHSEMMPVAKQAQELLQTLSLTLPECEYNAELRKIKQLINTKGKSTRRLLRWDIIIHHKKQRRSVILTSLVFLALGIGGFFLFNYFNRNQVRLMYTANNNEKPMVLILSDSTIVTLNPHSTLSYPAHFPRGHRDVHLSGEARFHVKRNENAPFRVYSENIIATVLGTVFNIRRSADSSIIELLQGKLSVKLNQPDLATGSILLLPNERAIYVGHDRHFYKKELAHNADLSFRQSNFSEIATRIKMAFGTTIINRSSKKGWRFTGVFKNTSAIEVINNICEIKNLSAIESGDTIYIKDRQ